MRCQRGRGRRCRGRRGRCRRRRHRGRLQQTQFGQPLHVEVLLRLEYARIQPQQPMPAEAHVQLLRFAGLAGARGPQRSAQDAEHGRTTGGRTAGALERYAVDGAGLLVVLESTATLGVLLAVLGDGVTGGRRLVHHRCAAAAAAGCGGGWLLRGDEIVGGPLGADGMQFFLGAHADVVAFGGFSGKYKWVCDSTFGRGHTSIKTRFR